MGLIWTWLDHLTEGISAHTTIAVAVSVSIVLVVWGNGIVLWSQAVHRRKDERASELLTLLAHTVAALVALGLSLWAGFSARDLGLAAPRFGRPHWLALAFLGTVALIIISFSALGLARHREPGGLWKVKLVRLLIGTAGGEEFLFRGFLLAIWAATGASNAFIVLANMVTFGLWHVAGARKEQSVGWSAVLGPGGFAFVFLASRLAFDSLLLPWLLHTATNLPGLALGLKGSVIRRGNVQV